MQSNFKLNANMDKNTINNNGHEYVDLGLPSGKLWATCNVGASIPTETGDYFMWGSTKPNNETTCNAKCMPFSSCSKNYQLSRLYFERYRNKFCPNDTLALKYDIVHITMGGDWHMPTVAQILELKDNTTSKWVTNYQSSGVNGRLFTSTKDSSKSIFFPFTGLRWGDSFCGEGNCAGLWSSSFDGGSSFNAWYLRFDSGEVCLYRGCRWYGFSVRGVI